MTRTNSAVAADTMIIGPGQLGVARDADRALADVVGDAGATGDEARALEQVALDVGVAHEPRTRVALLADRGTKRLAQVARGEAGDRAVQRQ